jgi:hypothetical protein
MDSRTPTIRSEDGGRAFSRAMDVVLGPEVREYTINYIDDLLIVSSSF